VAYEAVIGLECHVQLATRTKMFCDCPVGFGAEPNTNVCPVCLGLPGALPRTNAAAVHAALRVALALGASVRPESVFARKNYFYPDMPKNYQITQYDRPLGEGGALPANLEGSERRFALARVHLEEDTGKSFHPERPGTHAKRGWSESISRLDFNRAGVPLLEIVTAPVFGTPAECGAFLSALRRLVRWLGVSAGDMEKGHLRCDANVSLRPAGATELGTKTELKNLNSIRGVEKGLAAEIARQRGMLEAGGTVEQATLLYDLESGRLAVMRTKEYAHDYRYFPDPDLPPLRVDRAALDEARAALPELPWARAARLAREGGLTAAEADRLCADRALADHYEDAVRAGAPARRAGGWILNELLRALHERGLSFEEGRERIPSETLADLVRRLETGSLTSHSARCALDEILAGGTDPAAALERAARTASRAAEDLLPLVRTILDENAAVVAEVQRGRTRSFEFLVGQAMKKSRGQADPKAIRELLGIELARRGGPAAG